MSLRQKGTALKKFESIKRRIYRDSVPPPVPTAHPPPPPTGPVHPPPTHPPPPPLTAPRSGDSFDTYREGLHARRHRADTIITEESDVPRHSVSSREKLFANVSSDLGTVPRKRRAVSGDSGDEWIGILHDYRPCLKKASLYQGQFPVIVLSPQHVIALNIVILLIL